jgi:hypothetical protein
MTREDFDAIMKLADQIRPQVQAEMAAYRREIRNAVLFGYARGFAILTALWLLATISGS